MTASPSRLALSRLGCKFKPNELLLQLWSNVGMWVTPKLRVCTRHNFSFWSYPYFNIIVENTVGF
jgi:hypothetical protein